MKKLLVFAVMFGILFSVIGLTSAVDQDFNGTIVVIEANALSFGNIVPPGPTPPVSTNFTVDPEALITDQGLYVSSISKTVNGNANVQFSANASGPWANVGGPSSNIEIPLNESSLNPTLWIRLNAIGGTGAINGTISYTIMAGFSP